AYAGFGQASAPRPRGSWLLQGAARSQPPAERRFRPETPTAPRTDPYSHWRPRIECETGNREHALRDTTHGVRGPEVPKELKMRSCPVAHSYFLFSVPYFTFQPSACQRQARHCKGSSPRL